MATGKELVRMMTCGNWNDTIKTMPEFCHAQILDQHGKVITKKQAENSVFCHTKILFKGITEREASLIALILRSIASTPGETMCMEIFNYYGNFYEIVIS